MNYWEIIARSLKKRGWSLGWVSAVDSEARTIRIVDAHRDDGKRFVVHTDELLTAFLELERAVCIGLLSEQLLAMTAAMVASVSLCVRMKS